MSRSFVVVGESATVMADLNSCFVEIDELVGTPRCGVRTMRRAVPTSSKNGIKRILRKDVLDIGDQQFLMLLLMVNAQNQDRFDYIKQLFVRSGK